MRRSMERYGGLPVGRVPRGLCYLSLIVTGIFAFISPSDTVSEATGWGVYLWAAFLFLGGAYSLWGVITDKWIGEYVGLIPLTFAFIIYSVVMLGSTPVSWGRMALGSLLLAMAMMMIVRHREVSFIRKVATHSANKEDR